MWLERIKRFYKNKDWDKEWVKDAVKEGVITEEEYREIVGEDYPQGNDTTDE